MASGTTQLNINKFDPSKMKQWRTMIFVGKRGSGKSVLMKDIVGHLSKNVDIGLAMSPTEESAAFFRSILPPTLVHEDYNEEALVNMIDFQRRYIRKNKNFYHVMLLLDDCMYDKKIMKGKPMRDLFMNGRHLKITFCNALQYCMDMGPDLRSNTDYVFCLRENIIENRQRLYKYFFGMFNSYDEFARVMDTCTANYECLVLDNTTGSNKVEESVFWYKADANRAPFKLGRRWSHKLSHMYCKSQEEIDEEEEACREAEEEGGASGRGKTQGLRVVKRSADGVVV